MHSSPCKHRGTCFHASLPACRWAMNNVATYGTPSCTPTLAQLQADPGFLAREAAQSKRGNSTNVDMVQSGDAERVRLHKLSECAH